MLLRRDELHAVTVALMMAINDISTSTGSDPEDQRLRDEYLPRWRALLERFSD